MSSVRRTYPPRGRRAAPSENGSVIAALSELSADVQRARTIDGVLATAARGTRRLGMRIYAFEVDGEELVLRCAATSPTRAAAIERHIGRPLLGLRASSKGLPLVADVVNGRRIVHREDLDLFHSFMRAATGFDPATLDAAPETAGIDNGVLAPITVQSTAWGLLGVVSRSLTEDDADAVALFATHIGTAIEGAGFIAELERTNRELARCYADLACAQRDRVERERLAALGELAAVVAHEVRNPLCVLFNAVGGLHTFVRQGAPEDGHARAALLASIAAEETRHLDRIVRDLLDFARPSPPTLTRESLVPVLEGVVGASSDRRVHLEVEEELPVVAHDPLSMRQALLNLVLNALQAVGDDGAVTVRARREGNGYVCIDVVDDGPGIPVETRDRIFTPFFTTKPTGTGLGLAVVKRIVEAHDAEIGVTSTERGTTFTILLPADRAAPVHTQAVQVALAASPASIAP